MVGVVVHLEDKWNYTQSDRDIDILQMYEETVKALGVDTFIIIDKTTDGMVHNFGSIDITYAKYNTLEEALAAHPSATKFYFEHKRAIPVETKYITLDELVHPLDNVLYIFGGDEIGLDLSNVDGTIVSIEVSHYILWSIVAMSLVLYDRYIKGK